MGVAKYLNPIHWTRLSKKSYLNNDNQRRDMLFSQILLVGIVISTAHLLNDLINSGTAAYTIDAVFVLLLVIFYILNENGYHRLAKILDLSMLSLLIFMLAGVLDERNRMVYNFFPIAILAFLIFYKTEMAISIFFSTVLLVLMLILELTNYKPFGDIQIKEGVDKVTLSINVFGSFILMVIGLVFLVRLNKKAETEIIIREKHLGKVNAELDRFVYSASHDLRAPLLSIKGLTNLMRYEQVEAPLVAYLDKIDGRINDMDYFIKEIIDHSRNARTSIKNESIDLRKLINEVFEKLKYIEGAAQIDLNLDIKLRSIKSDISRLDVILSNLIANAIKYADRRKSIQKIQVRTFINSGYPCIEIIDNGLGILPQHQNNIFDMFYRASTTSEGTGLGLYIVKEMIEKLGGEISLQSQIDEGSTFTIKLLP